MRLLFLDIDNVMNCNSTIAQTTNGWVFVDEDKLSMLAAFVKEHDIKVVLSSTWRLSEVPSPLYGSPTYHQDFLELKELFEDYGIEFFGFTPYVRGEKGEEIVKYLVDNELKCDYAIIDDDQIRKPVGNKSIQTSPARGLEPKHLVKLLDIYEGRR